MDEQQNRQRPPISRWIMLFLFLLAGVFLGKRIEQRQQNVMKIDAERKLSKLELIVEQVQENYVDTVDVYELIENTLPLFMAELDPHSVYISAEDMSKANESIEGKFDGIGVSFNMSNDTVIVMSVTAGGPSEKVGIVAGDRIIKVDDSIIAGQKINQNDIVKMLRGKRGTKVNVAVARAGEKNLLSFVITRDKIPVKSVDAAFMLTPSTAFLKLSKFSKTTHDEFVEAIEKLRKDGMKNLILDLRGNGGGLLEQSFEISNEFLEAGDLIVYTEGRARGRYNFIANGKGICRDIQLAVLIDEESASASEIVSGAIQDNDRGTVIGRRSYGKGLVQEPIMFSDNSGIRLTVSRYYTPTGRCIQKPYTKDNRRAYEYELYERYLHGEMNEVDSIKLAGEKFVTPEGKVVYGGGGIMPDLFIPIDTVGVNDYFTKASRRNLIYRFALQFTDRHRAELNAIKSIDKLNAYFANYKFAELFRNYAAEAGLTTSNAEFAECRHIIEAQSRASIGRNTPLDSDAFYSMISVIDNTMQAAINNLEN